VNTVSSHLLGRFWQNACRIRCRAVPSQPVRLGSTEIIAYAPPPREMGSPECGRPTGPVAIPPQE
jgi:hypothetical protein